MPVKRLTAAEAAQRLGGTSEQVHALIRNGRLKAEKFGWVWMIKEQDLEGVQIRPKGRPRPDTCMRGHPFTEANTYVYPSGSRGCRICMNARSRRNYTTKSAESLDK